MKYRLIFFIFSLFLFIGCDEKDDVARTSVGISIEYPAGLDELSVQHETLKFKNISSGVEIEKSDFKRLSLPEGLYDCSYDASITYTKNGETVEGKLRGYRASLKVLGPDVNVSLNSYLLEDKDDFIIEEIFFTGTLQPSGKQYYGDQYVKIYNNTDHVLYADGVSLMESKFTTVNKYDYSPDIMSQAMTVHAVYTIPGNGTEYPVQPGESLLICDTGIDHRIANPNSFDLSRSDFEWYDESTVPSQMDIDSPTVPNLDKYYCYTLSFWILHNRGFRAFALARIPEKKEDFLKNYLYTYKYVMVLPAGTFPMEQTAYKVPNDWIIDAVNAGVQSRYVWNVTDPSLDSGWTHCGTIDGDKTRYFKSVRRKLLYITRDGRKVLKDTNNSSDDFNTECVPSVIEEQHTAIDANGITAINITYDGVTLKTE